jgi:hypothetical protein
MMDYAFLMNNGIFRSHDSNCCNRFGSSQVIESNGFRTHHCKTCRKWQSTVQSTSLDLGTIKRKIVKLFKTATGRFRRLASAACP